MNKAQKGIAAIFVLLILLTLVRPPWQQKYNGARLLYQGDLGQHFLWNPPTTTGESSWIIRAPASKCVASVDSHRLGWQIETLAVVAGLLLFFLRRRSYPREAKYVVALGLVLFGLAAFIVFVVHPGGFEGQIAWLVGLFPGVLAYGAFAGDTRNEAPSLLRTSLCLSCMFVVTVVWYLALADAFLSSYRFLIMRFSKRVPSAPAKHGS